MKTKTKNQENLDELLIRNFKNDEEFERYKRIVELGNEDERFETQKNIVISITISFIILPLLVIIAGVLGYDDNLKNITELAPLYFISSAGIIGVFIGGEAYKAVKR